MSSIPQVYIETFGCQMNEHDSQHLSQALLENGFNLCDNKDMADVVLVNSCSVRNGPENKLFSYLGRIRSLKKQRPKLIIGVGGCVAQQEKEQIFKRESSVDIVFGPDNIMQVPSLVKQAFQKKKQLAVNWNKGALEQLSGASFKQLPQKGRAYIAITKGCDNFCSFCIVPFTRGREFSREASSIVAESKLLIQQGAKELTLVGQNVNSYNCAEVDFLTLLKMVADLPGLQRLNFISPHPKDWNKHHSQLMASHPVICNQLHLPFQAGSSRILKMMRRDHNIENYLEKITYIKQLIPDISLSTDIIVGFPTETEQDFEQTLKIIEEVQFMQVFAFKYSPRPGTRASKLADDVPQKVKEERLSRLLKLQKSILHNKLLQLVGVEQDVLIHDYNDERKQYKGKTAGNLTVFIDNLHSLQAGNIYPVRINEAYTHSLQAELINVG